MFQPLGRDNWYTSNLKWVGCEGQSSKSNNVREVIDINVLQVIKNH